MSETVIYLAGPVAACEDGGAGWREEVKEHHGDEYEFRDPLDKYNRRVDDLVLVDGRSDPDDAQTVGVEDIVERDKRYIDEADGVLVGYTAVRSIGTPMEVMYARERDMPVALWIRDDTDFEEISPWYRYHATCFTTAVGMALSHLGRDHAEDLTGVGVRA